MVVSVLTGRDTPWRLGDENVTVLATAARLAPERVMDVVGSAILDPSRRPIFGVLVFRGLFDAIGVDAVKNWVDGHGRQHLRRIVRHFASPTVDETGAVVVPPLTRWLFTELEHDQEAFEGFLTGRRDGAFVRSGELSHEKRREMEPFLNHHLRRVREWAAEEVRYAEQEDEWFRQWDEEDERL